MFTLVLLNSALNFWQYNIWQIEKVWNDLKVANEEVNVTCRNAELPFYNIVPSSQLTLIFSILSISSKWRHIIWVGVWIISASVRPMISDPTTEVTWLLDHNAFGSKITKRNKTDHIKGYTDQNHVMVDTNSKCLSPTLSNRNFFLSCQRPFLMLIQKDGPVLLKARHNPVYKWHPTNAFVKIRTVYTNSQCQAPIIQFLHSFVLSKTKKKWLTKMEFFSGK